MTSPALRVDELRAPFGSATGLEGVSFEVQAGERFALVGPSGAGKTTLLRAIAGLSPCTAKHLEIAGQDVRREPIDRRGVVYLHQTPLLFPHLTVAGNVGFPLRVRGARGPAATARVAELLGAVRLEAFAQRMPHTLSGGQRHRVALARAMAARPAVLLLDEPFTALDPALRQEVREAVSGVQDAYGPAVVIVTHDLDEAAALAARVGVLLDRRLVQVSSPEELLARPATLSVARFVGIPNRVEGTVDAAGWFHSPLGRLRPHGSPPPGPCTACFRPRAIRATVDGAIPGRVVAVRHRVHGSTLLVEVAGQTLEAALDGVRGLDPGTTVRLDLAADELILFPAE